MPDSYWEECKLGKFDEELAGLILRLCIAHGSHEAIRMFQQALNRAINAHIDWVPVNGIVSDSTIEFASSVKASDVILELKRLADQHKKAA